jgi:hypothetical protein
MALSAWLLLTNLSLGMYHRHEATASETSAAHRASPLAWHYHLLLLGFELDVLSVNTETSPFDPSGSPDQETHLLLSGLLAPCPDHEPAPTAALVLWTVAMFHPPAACAAHDELQPVLALTCDLSGLPPPEIALGARSGVQQI